ncbi:MAG TPA: hypothetical protein VEI52_15760 [Terriglobales bacterium]|nr:hypothetical protein [Terriglobales bacterium]
MKAIFETRRIFVAVFAIGIFALGFRNATDPDLWWHLRTGQLMLETHQLFHADPYSFTKFGQPWVNHEWLSQIVIYGLYRFTGWGGLITAFAALIALAFFIVFLRSKGQPYVAGTMTVWGAIASVPSFGVRPQMFTLLLASLLLYVLERSQQRVRLLWWIPALMVFWVNLHAGYALGIAFLLIFLLGDALELALGHSQKREAIVRMKTLAMVTAAAIAVVPLGPYGRAMYLYPFETLNSRAMLAYIGEWQSPDFHQGKYLAALCLLLACLAIPALSPGKLRARELLLLAFTVGVALRSVRHIPIFALVSLPLLSAVIQARFDHMGSSPFDRRLPLTPTKLILNVVLLIGFLGFAAARVSLIVAQQGVTETKEFPAGAVRFVKTAQAPAPLMNHYNWGGYFIWQLYPEYRVYIDGRADVYGDSFLEQFAATYYLRGSSWRSGLERWGVRTVVLPPDAPLVTALSSLPQWKVVFSDRQATVLTRVP